MRRLVGCLLVLPLLLGATPAPEGAAPPGSVRAKVIELMELTGAKNMGNQMAQAMIAQLSLSMQQANPSIPKRAHEVIRDVTIEVVSDHSGELISDMIPLYEKYFTTDDLDALLAFYHTPTGRKSIETFPKLMQDAIPISQAWAQALQPLLEKRLREQLAAEGLLP